MWTIAPHTHTHTHTHIYTHTYTHSCEWSYEVRHGIKDIPHRSRWSVWHHFVSTAVNKMTFFLDELHSASTVRFFFFLRWWSTTDGLIPSGGSRGQVRQSGKTRLLATVLRDKFGEGVHMFHFVELRSVAGVFWMEWLGSFEGRNEAIMWEACPSWTWSGECLDWHFQNVSIWPHGDTHNKNERWPRTTLQQVQIL